MSLHIEVGKVCISLHIKVGKVVHVPTYRGG